jgi:hypothetical protein
MKRLIILLLLVLFVTLAVAQDLDDDGLSDQQELELGTDLNDMDSDDDGFADGIEFEVGSNPMNAKDQPMKHITGFAASSVSGKSYLFGLLALTVIVQVTIAFHMIRGKKDHMFR